MVIDRSTMTSRPCARQSPFPYLLIEYSHHHLRRWICIQVCAAAKTVWSTDHRRHPHGDKLLPTSSISASLLRSKFHPRHAPRAKLGSRGDYVSHSVGVESCEFHFHFERKKETKRKISGKLAHNLSLRWFSVPRLETARLLQPFWGGDYERCRWWYNYPSCTIMNYKTSLLIIVEEF